MPEATAPAQQAHPHDTATEAITWQSVPNTPKPCRAAYGHLLAPGRKQSGATHQFPCPSHPMWHLRPTDLIRPSTGKSPSVPSFLSTEVEGGGGASGCLSLRLKLLPALVQHHHWLPAQRKSSHTPPQSSYLWNEHTEGRVPLDST